jgi:hypothetical protein
LTYVRVAALLPALAVAGAAWAGDGPPYTLQKVADLPRSADLVVPALNDSGVVAYGAGNQLYVGAAGAVRQFPAGGLSSPLPVAINRAGQVAFEAFDDSAAGPGTHVILSGVYRANPDGSVTTIAPSPVDSAFAHGAIGITDAGAVGFTTVPSGFGSPGGDQLATISTGDGDTPPVVRYSVETYTNSPRIGPAMLSHDGHVAHVLWERDATTLLLDNRPVLTPSTSFFDPEFNGSGTLALANFDVAGGGRIALAADWGSIGTSIYTSDNGAIRRVAGAGLGDAVPVVALNDSGAVAAAYPDRISVFRDGREDVVVRVGEPFDGSTVARLSFGFGPEGFNDADQVAFSAALADGRDVVVVGSVPEPGAAALVVAAAGLLLRRRH